MQLTNWPNKWANKSVLLFVRLFWGIAKYRLTEALRNGKILSYITVGDIGGIRICGEDSSIISTAELMQKNSLQFCFICMISYLSLLLLLYFR